MDELISLALNAVAERNAKNQPPAAGATTAERYQRMLEALRARAAAPPGVTILPSAPSQTMPSPPQPRTPAPRAPTPPPPPPAAPPERGPLHGLFEGSSNLLRAVVAAELLDRPLALRENAHWQKR